MTGEETRAAASWDEVTKGELGVGAPVEFTAADETIPGVIDALWIPAHPTPSEFGGVVVMCRVKTEHERYPYWIGPHTQLRRI